jgi:hypothetical protein
MPDLRHDRSIDESLDHYWDAILAGNDATAESNLDPDLAAAARHVQALDLSPPPHPTFALTLWESLMNTTTTASSTSLFANELTALPPALHPWSGSRRSLPARGWSRLAAAVLLVGLLVGSVVAALYPLHLREGRPVLVIAPASTPSAQATIEPVFYWTLPEDLVPRSGNLDVVLWNAVIDPNTVTPILAEEVDCCAGPQISHVMDGELSLRIDGPMWIFRGNEIVAGESSAVDVAPGTFVTLHAGDTAVYAFSTGEYANRGSAPAHLIGGAMLAGSMQWPPAGFALLDGNEAYAAPSLPPGPIDVALSRAVLPPKASVPAPSQGSRVLEVGASGDASIAQQADGGLRNVGPQEETIYVFTISPAVGKP